MAIRNRELSQFGSFISINDETQSISITEGIGNSVGIGTSTPQQKLHVAGNTYIDGDLEVGGTFDFNFDGFKLEGNVDINTTGIITAKRFESTEGILTITDRWDRDGNNIFRLNGSVGIGTSNPQSQLDVTSSVRASTFISTVTATGSTPPFSIQSSDLVQYLNADFLRGGAPGRDLNTNDIITRGDTQTLSNKKFDSNGVVFKDSSNKETILKASSNASPTLSLPRTNGTLVSTGDTGVVTANMIIDLSITNTDIASTASIDYSKLNLTNSIKDADLAGNISNSKLTNNSISGIQLGGTLNSLSFIGSYWTSNTSYNGSSAVNISLAATDTYNGTSDAGKLVARTSSGDIAANTLTLNGNLSATNGTISSKASNVGSNGLRVTDNGGLSVTGLSTFSGITTVTGSTLFTQQLNVSGVSTFNGITTVTGSTLFTQQLNVSGVSTFNGITTVTGSTLFSKQLNVSGVSTFNGITTVTGSTLFTQQFSSSGITSITNTQNATSTSTGALVVSGGVGIGNSVHIGGNAIASQFVKSGVSTTNILQAGGGDISLSSVALPPGIMLPYVSITPPTGWLLCDGSSYNITTYAALFAVIGYQFGGSGSSFNVPNMLGYIPVGTNLQGTDNTPDPGVGASLGEIGGVAPNNEQPSTGGSNSGALIKYFAYIIKT